MHDVVPFAILHSWSLSMTTRPPMEAIFFEIKMNLFVVLYLHSKESCFHNKYGIQICSRLGVSPSQGRGRELAPASLDQSPGPRTRPSCWVNSPKLTWVYFYKKAISIWSIFLVDAQFVKYCTENTFHLLAG